MLTLLKEHQRDIAVVSRRLVIINPDPTSKQFRDALDKLIALLERNLAQPKTLLAAGRSGMCNPTLDFNKNGIPFALTLAERPPPENASLRTVLRIRPRSAARRGHPRVFPSVRTGRHFGDEHIRSVAEREHHRPNRRIHRRSIQASQFGRQRAGHTLAAVSVNNCSTFRRNPGWITSESIYRFFGHHCTACEAPAEGKLEEMAALGQLETDWWASIKATVLLASDQFIRKMLGVLKAPLAAVRARLLRSASLSTEPVAPRKKLRFLTQLARTVGRSERFLKPFSGQCFLWVWF